MKISKLLVKTNNKKYPIIIGNNIINNISNLIKNNSVSFKKCLIIFDKKVPNKFLKKIKKNLKNKKIITYVYLFNSSEANKNQKNVDKLLNILLKYNFHRNDCLISVGGGITGDVSGFAASIYKRGISFINIPTTLLAQVDSSIGGKTGINSKFGKNLVGSFYQPDLVISDINFLKSLPKREIVCGYAEVLKHSLIKEKKFFNFLDRNADKILKLKNPFIQNTIYKSCLIKKKIVEIDENEKNLRKILNFGHTFAHAYEATMEYSKKINHGEAVLLGIISAVQFGFYNNILSKKNYNKINNHFLKYNLPKNINKFFNKKNIKQLLSFMKKDKKNKNKLINLILLKKIGLASYNSYFNQKKINSFFLKKLFN